MTRTVQARHLTWPEMQERLEAGAIVFLPVGAFEQHGLHLPLDTDTRLAEAIAERVAAEVDGVVLPALAYGARSLTRSGGGDPFPATTNLSGATLTALVQDVVLEQARHGARAVVVLLGHGENDPFAVEGVSQAIERLGDRAPQVLIIGWWHVVPESAVAPLFPEGFPGWDREHAARIETALMLAVAPEAVRDFADIEVDPIEVPPYTRLPVRADSVPRQGSLADPRGATAEAGHALLEWIVTHLTEVVTREVGLHRG